MLHGELFTWLIWKDLAPFICPLYDFEFFECERVESSVKNRGGKEFSKLQ